MHPVTSRGGKVKDTTIKETQWIVSINVTFTFFFFLNLGTYLTNGPFSSLSQLSLTLKKKFLGWYYCVLITVEGIVACDCVVITKALECPFIPLKMTLALDHRALH